MADPKEEPTPKLCFPPQDSVSSRQTWLSQNPCGREVTGLEAILYPNPATERVQLQLNGMLGGHTRVDVFSESGQLFFTQLLEIQESIHTIELNLSGAKSGVYFVRIVHGGYEKALRLVKVS